MPELKDMLKVAINDVKSTTDLFYQQKEHDAYVKFNTALESISSVVEKLFFMYNETGFPEFSQEDFMLNLNNAMNALQEKDAVLLADVLQYDLLEQFEKILKQIEKI